MFRPNLDMFRGILGFLDKTKTKACKIDFGLMVKYTVLRWDTLSHLCRNLFKGPVSYLIGGFKCAVQHNSIISL